MMEPVTFRKRKPRKLPPKDWALTGAEGRGQNIVRSLWLKEGALEKHNYKLQEKYKKIEKNEVICEQYAVDDAEIVLVSYGVAARMVKAAVTKARGLGIKAGWIRPVSLWPFPTEQVSKAAEDFKIFLTVEMSLGQMVDDVKLAVEGRCPVLFYGRPGGGVPGPEQILEKIKQLSITPKKSTIKS